MRDGLELRRLFEWEVIYWRTSHSNFLFQVSSLFISYVPPHVYNIENCNYRAQKRFF